MAPQKPIPKPDDITCLYEVSLAIHSTLELKEALYKVLDLLAEHLGMNRGSITLLNPETSEIHIEVAHGISSREKTKGRYKMGEGITGRVIETGRPMAVPDLSEEPLFLDRTGSRKRLDKKTFQIQLVSLMGKLRRSMGRDQNDLDLWMPLAYQAGQFQPIHMGHLKIGDEQVKRFVLKACQGLDSRMGHLHLEARAQAAQAALEQPGHIGLIIHYEYSSMAS